MIHNIYKKSIKAKYYKYMQRLRTLEGLLKNKIYAGLRKTLIVFA